MSRPAIIPLEDYKDGCDAIREKVGTADTIKSGELRKKVYDVYEAGKKAEYDRFWDLFQNYGKRTRYDYAFYQQNWKDDTYNPKYPIVTGYATYSAENIFAWSDITDTKVPIEINSTTSAPGIFKGCDLLETVRELYINKYDFAYTSWFHSCKNLKNLTIKGSIKNNGFDVSAAKDLTDESLLSITKALYDYRGTVYIANGVSVRQSGTLATGWTLSEGQEYQLSVKYNGVTVLKNGTVIPSVYSYGYLKVEKTVFFDTGLSFARGIKLTLSNNDTSILCSTDYAYDAGYMPFDPTYPTLVITLTTVQATETRTITFSSESSEKMETIIDPDTGKTLATIAGEKGWSIAEK